MLRFRSPLAVLAVTIAMVAASGCAEDPSYAVRWRIDGSQPAELESPKQCSEVGISDVRMTTKDALGVVADSRLYPCFPPEFFDLEAAAGGPELPVGTYTVELQPLRRDGSTAASATSHTVEIGSQTPVLIGDAVFVPPIECEDGIDNDRDGAIDLADPGCRLGVAEDDDVNLVRFRARPRLFDNNPLVTDCRQVGLASFEIRIDREPADGVPEEVEVIECGPLKSHNFVRRLDPPDLDLYKITAVGRDAAGETITQELETVDKVQTVAINLDFTADTFTPPVVAPLGFFVNFKIPELDAFDELDPSFRGCQAPVPFSSALDITDITIRLYEDAAGAIPFGDPIATACNDTLYVSDPLTWASPTEQEPNRSAEYYVVVAGSTDGETCFESEPFRGAPDIRTPVEAAATIVGERPAAGMTPDACADCFTDIQCGGCEDCCDFIDDTYDDDANIPAPDPRPEVVCSDDAGCPGSLRCSPSGQCVECHDEAACPAGFVCNAEGLCQCFIDDDQCGAGLYCGPDRRCHDGSPGDACFADTCAGETPCIFGVCRCNQDADCPLDGACEENRCVCSSTDNCPGSLKCDVASGECQTCTENSHCADDEYCTYAGECAARTCNGPDDCGGGDFCGPDFTCSSGAVGESCLENNPQQECDPGLLCGPDWRCHQGLENDPCASVDDCADGLYCAPTGRCADGSLFDACDTADDQCGGSRYCADDGTCSDGDLGRPCDNAAMTDPCQAPYYCGADNLCHDGSLGDSCSVDDDCSNAAHYCGPNNVCHDGSFGDGCSDDMECTQAGLICVPVPNADGDDYKRCQPPGVCIL